jgi:hypothetical protein
VELLAKMPPLESGDPYEMTVDGVKVWRPRWTSKIDDKVNALYIAEVVQCVWDNETV